MEKYTVEWHYDGFRYVFHTFVPWDVAFDPSILSAVS